MTQDLIAEYDVSLVNNLAAKGTRDTRSDRGCMMYLLSTTWQPKEHVTQDLIAEYDVPLVNNLAAKGTRDTRSDRGCMMYLAERK